MNFGAVILAGGKSRRMGQNKAQLTVNGKSFLDIIGAELSGFAELMVSVDDAALHPEILLPMVSDAYSDCGPMSGIFSALSSCKSEALLAVSCDLPLFKEALALQLCEAMTDEVDAVIPVTADGFRHLLSAVYSKRCAMVFQRLLKAGNFRLRDALQDLKVVYFDAKPFTKMLTNVNTPEEYNLLLKKEN